MDEIEASMNEDPKDAFFCALYHRAPTAISCLCPGGWIGWYHILTSMSAAPNSLISMIRTQKGSITEDSPQLTV